MRNALRRITISHRALVVESRPATLLPWASHLVRTVTLLRFLAVFHNSYGASWLLINLIAVFVDAAEFISSFVVFFPLGRHFAVLDSKLNPMVDQSIKHFYYFNNNENAWLRTLCASNEQLLRWHANRSKLLRIWRLPLSQQPLYSPNSRNATEICNCKDLGSKVCMFILPPIHWNSITEPRGKFGVPESPYCRKHPDFYFSAMNKHSTYFCRLTNVKQILILRA